jgi:hypothetical protein
MSKHTLEQVLEALINKEEDRASELLHRYFVSKGKSIYEELSQFDEAAEEDLEESEEEIEEGIGGAADQDFEEEIIADEADLEDEQLFGEAEGDDEEDPMSADEPAEDEATADLAMGDEPAADMPAGEEGASGDAEEALQKVDDALADLKAIFADLMGDQAGDMDMPAEEPKQESFSAFGEGVALKAVPAAQMGDNGQNTKSPVATSKRVDGNGAKAVNFTGEADKGMADPSVKTDDMGNVNKVGNAKAPAQKSVSVPKNSDAASNKTSPVAKA